MEEPIALVSTWRGEPMPRDEEAVAAAWAAAQAGTVLAEMPGTTLAVLPCYADEQVWLSYYADAGESELALFNSERAARTWATALLQEMRSAGVPLLVVEGND